MRLFLLGFLALAYVGFGQSASLKLFILDKDIRMGTEVTESSIRRIDGVDSISVTDDLTLQDFRTTVMGSVTNQPTRGVKALDLRMLIEWTDQNKVQKLGISRLDVISVNGVCYEYDAEILVQILKRNIPPDLHWYVASDEEIEEYRMRRFNSLIDSIPSDTIRSDKKKKRGQRH